MEQTHDTNNQGTQPKSGMKPEVPNEQPQKETQAPKLHKTDLGQTSREPKEGAERTEEEKKNRNTGSNPHSMKPDNLTSGEIDRNDQKKAV